MVKQLCESCNAQFEYDLKPGYPRKYCTVCSAAKKASYAAKDSQLQVNGVSKEINGKTFEIDKIPTGGLMDARSASIVAQVCLKGAVELFNNSEVPMEKGIELCVQSYKLALQYLNE